MAWEVRDRTILVTGATSGIGLEGVPGGGPPRRGAGAGRPRARPHRAGDFSSQGAIQYPAVAVLAATLSPRGLRRAFTDHLRRQGDDAAAHPARRERPAGVPIMQAHKFYKALKKMGKTVEMEIFPRGGHVL